MRKVILILGIVLLAGCSKEDCVSFELQRIDFLYHNDLKISVVQHEPHYMMRYNITKYEAERICKTHTFPIPKKKVVSPIRVFGVVYPYYELEMTQTCKIKK